MNVVDPRALKGVREVPARLAGYESYAGETGTAMDGANSPYELRVEPRVAAGPTLHERKPVKSQLTRILHLSILLIVLHQLVNSLFIERPLPGEDPDWTFLLHEYVGIAGAVALAAFWVWTMVRDRRETPLGQLFPWFSPRRLGAIIAELRGTLADVLSGRGSDLALEKTASAFHGLGLVLVSFIAVTGAAWFFVFDGTAYGRLALRLHTLTANVMWFYIVAHASAALLHQWLGHDLFSRMFWFRRRSA